MSTHIKFILIFATVILAAIAAWIALPRQQSKTVALHDPGPAVTKAGEPQPPVGVVRTQTNVTTEPQRPEIQPTTQPAARQHNLAAKKGPKRMKKKVPLQDPAARVALSLVGVDSDAEAYWEQAIFDASLPDKEREDLMEDLNEVGFSDPKNPVPNDLPLIRSRIALIEQIAPYADPFMQRHLGEAYKDLNNMLEGKSVQ